MSRKPSAPQRRRRSTPFGADPALFGRPPERRLLTAEALEATQECELAFCGLLGGGVLSGGAFKAGADALRPAARLLGRDGAARLRFDGGVLEAASDG